MDNARWWSIGLAHTTWHTRTVCSLQLNDSGAMEYSPLPNFFLNVKKTDSAIELTACPLCAYPSLFIS